MSERPELTEEQRRLREKFVDERGYWNEFWEDLLSVDQRFFSAYLELSATPWRHGPLPPKFKELIYVAIDASTTHLYEPGLRQHIRNALKLGATTEEIMEVLELVSAIGIHSCTLGVPILREEVAAHGEGGI